MWSGTPQDLFCPFRSSVSHRGKGKSASIQIELGVFRYSVTFILNLNSLQRKLWQNPFLGEGLDASHEAVQVSWQLIIS